MKFSASFTSRLVLLYPENPIEKGTEAEVEEQEKKTRRDLEKIQRAYVHGNIMHYQTCPN
jgi:hypothetical protein